MGVNLGATDYHDCANQRLREAWILLENGQFSGVVYLGGRAVESMLRALLWKYDSELSQGRKSLDTGHELRDILSEVRSLGILHRTETALTDGVQRIGRLWFNNMRFVPTQKLQKMWRERGEIHPKRPMKVAALAFYQECSAVIKRCEVLYEKN